MRRVTRTVELHDLGDLLERVPRACVGFVSDRGPEAEEVRVEARGDAYAIGFAGDAPRPGVGDEVVLLIDDGVQFFDLRAIYVRGTVAKAESRGQPDVEWFDLQPTRRVAWHYGEMRYE